MPADVVLQLAQPLDAVVDPAQLPAQPRGAPWGAGEPLGIPVSPAQLPSQPLLDLPGQPDFLLPDQPVELAGDDR
jgi:hypothetical protein